MARVYIEYLGGSVELPIGETVVGRDLGCSLRFNDASVSRRHMRLIRREDDVFVEDLGSSNGTFINGRTIEGAIRLHHGDVVRCGQRELTIKIPVDYQEPSTLSLQDLAAANEGLRFGPVVTKQIPITVPPPLSANQRCPRCTAVVSSMDDECSTCKFRWGQGRPSSPTVLGLAAINRRGSMRAAVELRLIYQSSELEIEAITRDLSISGVFVCSQVLDPIGTECQMTILVDGGPALTLRGVVRRVVEHEETGREPIGLGIQFVDIQAAQRAWLDSVIARSTQGLSA